MSTIKQHIVVDISDETFITTPYNLDITGGIDISGLGRTIIKTDGTAEITKSITVNNKTENDAVNITPKDINISGIGNINIDTCGNAFFTSNNRNNNFVSISSETIIIDSCNNTGLIVSKQQRPDNNLANTDFDDNLSNAGNIVISEHGNCSNTGGLAGCIQFEASPFSSYNSNYVKKCGQFGLIHDDIINRDTWAFTFNLIGEDSYGTNGRKLYEVLKLSGKDRVGICGKDPERNLDVSGSFRVSNNSNYLNINNSGDIDVSSNIDISGNVNHLGNTTIDGNINMNGDINNTINQDFTVKNNNNNEKFIINNIGNVSIGSNTANEKLEIADGSLALINSTNFNESEQSETVVNNILFKHDTNPRGAENTLNTSAKISSIMESSTATTQSGRTGIGFYTATGWKYPDNSADGIGFINLSLTEKMRITSTGNVGIGTTNPARPLEVYSDGTGIGMRLTYSGDNSYYTDFRTNGININPLNHFTFDIQGNEKMRIASNGNVGIGTSNPTNKLHVIGDITTSGNISCSSLETKNDGVEITGNLTTGRYHYSNVDHGPDLMDKNNKYAFHRDSDNGYSYIYGPDNIWRLQGHGSGVTVNGNYHGWIASGHGFRDRGGVSSWGHSWGRTPVGFAIGDNDTGFGWPGDGYITVYTNGGYRNQWDWAGFHCDERIKGDIVEASDQESWTIVKNTEVYWFDYLDKNFSTTNNGYRELGFIAQQVKKTMPYAVTEKVKIIPNYYKIINNYIWEEIELTNNELDSYIKNNKLSLKSYDQTVEGTTDYTQQYSIWQKNSLNDINNRYDGPKITKFIDSKNCGYDTGTIDSEEIDNNKKIKRWKLTILNETLDIDEDIDTGFYQFYFTDKIKDGFILDNATGYSRTFSILNDRKSFITDKKWNHIFLQGKEVINFHIIDEKIFTPIHHSAIQQIIKNNEERDKVIDTLKTENIQLKDSLSILTSKLEALENLVLNK